MGVLHPRLYMGREELHRSCPMHVLSGLAGRNGTSVKLDGRRGVQIGILLAATLGAVLLCAHQTTTSGPVGGLPVSSFEGGHPPLPRAASREHLARSSAPTPTVGVQVGPGGEMDHAWYCLSVDRRRDVLSRHTTLLRAAAPTDPGYRALLVQTIDLARQLADETVSDGEQRWSVEGCPAGADVVAEALEVASGAVLALEADPALTASLDEATEAWQDSLASPSAQ